MFYVFMFCVLCFVFCVSNTFFTGAKPPSHLNAVGGG